jgi:hypothetical protein
MGEEGIEIAVGRRAVFARDGPGLAGVVAPDRRDRAAGSDRRARVRATDVPTTEDADVHVSSC